ncbi:alpha/beta fold hydrolase [Sphingomonas oligophenolica]|uniref:Alpha/beta hydrolase n=1 Tax=Sphingomonas oligophenolica TaxID=301154 RepID=A0ABU9YB94_9SPHN
MSNSYHDTKAGRLSVETHGSGPPIFFWPSLFLDRSIFTSQIAHFSRSYHVVAVDGPGHGESGKSVSNLTIEDCADAVEEILTNLGIRRASFIGASWGGLVGIAVATKYPELVDRLAIIGSPLAAPDRWERLQGGILLILYSLFGGRERMMRTLLSQGIGSEFRRARSNDFDALVRRLARVPHRRRLPAMRAVMLERQDMLSCLAQLQIPVMLIRGKDDAFLSVEQFARQAAALPAAAVRVIPGSGHLPSLEKGEETTAVLVDLLRGSQDS